MARGNSISFPLAMACLLLAACGHFDAQTQPPPPAPPIVVSLSSDAVYLVDARTGHARQVAGRLSDFQGGYGTWNSTHTRLAYGDNGIVVLDPKTNRERRVVRGRSLSMPAWSPDGRTLVYGDGISLWVAHADGAARPTRIRVPAILAPLQMAWSATGVIAFEGLALDCSQVLRCVSTGSSEIWTILPDGTGLTQLTHVGHAEKPKWSPDGLRLLFVRTYPKTKKPAELWSSDADGSNAHRVTGDGVAAADWSPDGSQLAVARASSASGLQLLVGNADGSRLRPAGPTLAGTDVTVDW